MKENNKRPTTTPLILKSKKEVWIAAIVKNEWDSWCSYFVRNIKQFQIC